jgi:hypothetical protein
VYGSDTDFLSVCDDLSTNILGSAIDNIQNMSDGSREEEEVGSITKNALRNGKELVLFFKIYCWF